MTKGHQYYWNESARSAGYKAYRALIPRGGNGYSTDPQASSDWLAGWDQAASEDRR